MSRTISDQEGPVERKEYYCSMCKYHSQRMMRSGRNPIYRHYCSHPDKKDDQNLKDYMYNDEGAFTGSRGIAPGWCPFLQALVNK